MQVIPLQAISAPQNLSVTLGGQSCAITVRQTDYGVFVTLSVSGVQVLGSGLACDRNRIVRLNDIGFVGDLIFYDTQGLTDPVSTGFGSRYKFAYITSADGLY